MYSKSNKILDENVNINVWRQVFDVCCANFI